MKVGIKKRTDDVSGYQIASNMIYIAEHTAVELLADHPLLRATNEHTHTHTHRVILQYIRTTEARTKHHS